MDRHSDKVKEFWGNEWKNKKQNYEDMKKDFLNNYKFKKIKPYLKKLPQNAKILEVGCGNSFWLRWIKEYFPDLELYGLDFSDEAIEISLRYGIKAIKGDIRNAPFEDEFFDLVFSWGVVEHFPETEKAVHEHIRITKKGSYTFIETPNKLSLSFIEYYTGNILFHHRSKQKTMVEHGNFFSSSTLKRFAETAKYKLSIKKYGTANILPLYFCLKPIDDLLPDSLRNKFGGNAGIIVHKLKL